MITGRPTYNLVELKARYLDYCLLEYAWFSHSLYNNSIPLKTFIKLVALRG